MLKGETLSATARAERARANTQRAMARDLFAGGVFARVWPSYLVDSSDLNAAYPWLLCVESPAGLMVWRLTDEEMPFVAYLPRRQRTTERPEDRLPILQALAEHGW